VLTPRPTDSYNLAPGLSALETLPSGIAFYELIRVNNEIDRGSSSCVSAPLPYYARDNRFRIRPIDGDGDGFADCDRGAVEAGLFTLTVSTTTSGLPDWQIELDQDLPTCSDAACLYAAIPPGSFVTLTAVAQAGTVFEGWGGACASAGTGACTLDMTESRSVSAAFSGLEEFPLSVSVTGSGNVSSNPAGIDCPGTCVTDFLDGSLVTLTATPSTGFELASWSGACSGAGACQVTMNQARNVTATFQLTEVPLQVRMEGTGSGRVTSTPAGINCTSDCSASFPPATTIDLTATPDAGSTFQNWTGACSGTGTCRVTMSAATTVGVVWIDDESIFIDGME
jgi:Fe-S cluster biogenesis protein NfuA